MSLFRRQHRQGGFTLLEAIVAMTIFVTSAMGLYAWINSMMIGTARFDEISIETTDVYNAVDYLANVNPMENPTGSARIGGMVMTWQSELVEPVRPGNLTPAYNVGLYELTVSLARPGFPTQELSLRQAGYRLRTQGIVALVSRDSSSGFTLLEVLVVLVITSMLSLLLIDGVGQVMMLERRMESRTSEYRVSQLQQHWIRQLLASARAHREHPFALTATSVSGLTLAPLAAEAGLPTPFELSLANVGELTELRYREGAGPVYTVIEFENAELRGSASFAALQNDGTYSPVWQSNEGGPQWPDGVALRLPTQEGEVVWHFAVPGRKSPPINVEDILGI